MVIDTSKYSENAVKYFNEKREKRDEALQHLVKRQENTRKYLVQDLQKIDSGTLRGRSIDQVIREELIKSCEVALDSVKKNNGVVDIKPWTFNFNGVEVYFDMKDIFWEELQNNSKISRKEVEQKINEYVGTLVDDYRTTMSAQHTAKKTISWQYIQEKKREKEQQQKEKKQNAIREKLATLPDMEFRDSIVIDISKLTKEQKQKYNVEEDNGRSIDDIYNMWYISWENLRKLGLDKNTDWYGRGIYTYAERWAKLMQNAIEKEWKSLQDVASKFSYEADLEGITWFMYGAAVSILS